MDEKGAGKTFKCPDCQTPIVAPKPTIFFNCSSCKCDLSAPDEQMGKVRDCPFCQRIIIISDSKISKPKLICPECSANLLVDQDDLIGVESKTIQCIGCDSEIDVTLLLGQIAPINEAVNKLESTDKKHGQLIPLSNMPPETTTAGKTDPLQEQTVLCNNCNMPAPINARYCIQCGKPIVYKPSATPFNIDIIVKQMLWACMGLSLLTLITSGYLIWKLTSDEHDNQHQFELSAVNVCLTNIFRELSEVKNIIGAGVPVKVDASSIGNKLDVIDNDVTDLGCLMGWMSKSICRTTSFPTGANLIMLRFNKKLKTRFIQEGYPSYVMEPPEVFSLDQRLSDLSENLIALKRDSLNTQNIARRSADAVDSVNKTLLGGKFTSEESIWGKIDSIDIAIRKMHKW